MITSDSSTATLDLARKVLTSGRRVNDTLELEDNTVTLTEPLRRHLYLTDRGESLPAMVYETLWVLEGSSGSIDHLGYFLPRAVDFSDDGETWRGAYGPRLRSHFGIDQIEAVISRLQENPSSRQAVLVIFDPSSDNVSGTKDVPCNNWIQFRVRGGQLNMTIVVRSNDLIWGFSGINTFEWSCLQQLVADRVGVSVGTQTWLQGSLHLYDRHRSRAEGLGILPTPSKVWASGLPFVAEPDELSKSLRTIHRWIDDRSDGPAQGSPETDSVVGSYTRFLQDVINVREGHSHLDDVLPTYSDQPDDFHQAAFRYFQRTFNK